MILTLFSIAIIVIFAYFKLFSNTNEKLKSNGKCVLITGCDSGIGLQLATHLHKLGFIVFAGVLSIDSDGAKKLSIEFDTERMHVVHLDITKQEMIDSVKSHIEKFLQRSSIDGKS